MKIKFLGTAAAEGWPAIFCACDACKMARKLKGKNIRTRSSCLIDDQYLVDFPPDTYLHGIMYELDFSRLKSVFVTHSHSDHFAPADFEMRYGTYAFIENREPLMLYGNNTVEDMFNSVFEGIDLEDSVIFNRVNPFESYKIDDFTLTPLPADHAQGEMCFIYVIQKHGKTLLYGNDSGYFAEETWDALLKYKFDLVILDCTQGPGDEQLGPNEYAHGHMGFYTNIKVKDRLIDRGAADENTKFVITHFSHNGTLMHDEFENLANPQGFITAYDGMEIEI